MSAKGHTAAARHLREAHGVPSWHCQMITVEYERARGLRVTNQNAKGDFQVSVTRTVGALLPEVLRAFTEARLRRRWLSGVEPTLVRGLEEALTTRGFTVKAGTLAQMRFSAGKSRVVLYVNAKPKGKSSVVVSNEKLDGASHVEQRRSAWEAALAALKALLAG